MGYRTVVVLNNDFAHKWQIDSELGKKISHAAAELWTKSEGALIEFQYGQVLECVHADVQTLAVLDGYSGKTVAQTFWHRDQTNEVLHLALLKELANKLGYNLSKKPVRK